MSIWQLRTPVAFLIFNRPEVTARVFSEIARVRPPVLLVVADGPRADRPGEAEKCRATRAIIDRVDWPCEVLTNYADGNLGCRRRVSSGLNWVFDVVEEAIILEDDCLPHPTFFRFCEELLEKYRDDERIAQISGDNFQFGRQWGSDSYYFSRYCHVWGWASWRRAWKHYDVQIRSWPKVRGSDALTRWFGGDNQTAQYWSEILDRTYRGEIDTWDYQWVLTCWERDTLTILPSVNLISNIGFGPEATHTVSKVSQLANMPIEGIDFPLRHPASVVRNVAADRITELMQYRGSSRRFSIDWVRNVLGHVLPQKVLSKPRRMVDDHGL
jgi:hypothetical protein